MRDLDAVVTLSSLLLPCRIDDPAAIARTYDQQCRLVFNVTGTPAISVPTGFTAERRAARHADRRPRLRRADGLSDRAGLLRGGGTGIAPTEDAAALIERGCADKDRDPHRLTLQPSARQLDYLRAPRPARRIAGRATIVRRLPRSRRTSSSPSLSIGVDGWRSCDHASGRICHSAHAFDQIGRVRDRRRRPECQHMSVGRRRQPAPSKPSVPDAPSRFSTTAVCPSRSVNAVATARPIRSTPLPGENGMMISMLRDGHFCCALAAPHNQSNSCPREQLCQHGILPAPIFAGRQKR